MKSYNNKLSNIILYLSIFLCYSVYTIFGLIIVITNYMLEECNYLWVYILLSLLIPIAFILIQLCTCPFLFTEFKNISYFMFLMVIFGGISVFSCIENSILWIFGLVTFIIQIIIAIFPIIMNLFLCDLKTPYSNNTIDFKELELIEITKEESFNDNVV